MVNARTLQTWRQIVQTMWTQCRHHQGIVRIKRHNRLIE